MNIELELFFKKMPKTLCAVCDGDNFDNIDGFYYCSICGTKYEAINMILFRYYFILY